MSTILSSLVSLLLIIVLYFVLYRRYALDNYRDQIFKVREALFDLAMDNKSLSFRSEVYRNFEILLNNNIRFAHRISFLGAVLFNIMNRIRYPSSNVQSKVAADFLKQVSEMRPSDAKTRIMQLQAAFETQTILFLLRTSPLFLVFVSLVAILFTLKQVVQPARVRSLVKGFLVGGVNKEIGVQAEKYCLAPG